MPFSPQVEQVQNPTLHRLVKSLKKEIVPLASGIALGLIWGAVGFVVGYSSCSVYMSYAKDN